MLVSLPTQIRVSAMLLVLTRELIQRWGDLQMYEIPVSCRRSAGSTDEASVHKETVRQYK